MDENSEIKENDYITLGLSALDREGDIHYTDCPGCILFEQAKGYQSKFSLLEDDIFAKLKAKEDVSSIIVLPYAKTLFNSDGVIKIGTRYFKEYDNNLIAIIGNNDRIRLDKLSSLSSNQISEDFNLRFTSKFEDNISEFYSLTIDDLPDTEIDVIDLKLNTVLLPNGKYEIENKSFIDYVDGSQAQYKWKYQDGTSFIGIEPNRTFDVNDTLELEFGNGTNGMDTTKVTIRACAITNLNITRIGNNTFRFGGELSDLTSYTVFWDFGDGSTASGSPVEHTYANNIGAEITVTLSALRISDGTLACQGSELLLFETDCDELGVESDDSDFTVNQEDWRIDVKIWIDRTFLTSGDVGSRTKTYKKGFLDIYYTKRCELVCADLVGNYYDVEYCNSITETTSEECEVNAFNVQRNINNNKARKNPGQLYSTHRMTVDGVDCVYPGQLILN